MITTLCEHGNTRRHFNDCKSKTAGCAFSDDFKSAKHVIGNTSEDLHKIMGSKYFQSDTQGIYKGVSDLLKRNEKVLFCGTPCQVAALRAYLGKEYDNLFLLDFI